jgi:hypothetical protein
MGPWTRQLKELLESGTRIDKASAGLDNSSVIVDTAKYTAPEGYFIAFLQVIAETVVANQTNHGTSSNATLSALTTIPVGVIIPTQLIDITLTSGQVIVFLSAVS